ncbi:PHD finger protein 7 isoform X1 [Ixodes scapularis]|uniref:PHD finger protein 7 isoform X1 n=1 Tax=Ixodes scapularis TaxID=6945 RepID=UPI001A9D7AC5|nr:PHD finger protein 7 isoform X1 [Ixodes scapularis]
MSPRRSRRLVRQERKLPAKLLEEDSAAVCCFCKKAQSSIVCDKLLNGKITAHFYCLLFSSGLQQRGDVGGPLMGFLEADIMIELRRGSKLRCVYCKKQGATLGCCIKMCKKVFHVDCGNASDCLLQFYGDYRAYCPYHRPHQRIRPKESGSTSCLICACDMVSEPSPQVLVTPCCQHSFHRACLQAQASSAGSYFFKCCTCNNIDAFQKEMLDHGICIPEQDASWEREQGAYQDLLYRYQRCDAERCRCPMGREASSEESGDWEVITCSTCGSQGIHKACGNLSREALQRANSWVCVQCRKTLSLRPGMEAVIPPSSPLKRKGATASTSSEPPITKAKETEPPVPEKTEVLPAAATPCSGISPLSSSPCSMIVPPSSSPCPKILPLSGSPCPEIPRPSGSPCPKITPPSSSLCSKILPLSGSPCPEIPRPSGSPCPKITPPSSSPCSKILPLSGSPCPEIPRPSGSPCPKITPPSSSPCSKILPLSGSPCSKIPCLSGSPCPKITPPSSSPCSEILPLSGSPRPWIPPLSGSLSSSGEAAGAAGSSPQSQKGGDDDSDVEIIAWYPKRSPPQFIVLDDSDDSEDSDLLCACPDCLP